MDGYSLKYKQFSNSTTPKTNTFAPENRAIPKRKLVFQASIFRCHVSFREGNNQNETAWPPTNTLREQHLTARRIRNLGLQKNTMGTFDDMPFLQMSLSSKMSAELEKDFWIFTVYLLCVQFWSTSSAFIPKHYTKTPLHRLPDSDLQSKPPSLKISPRRVFPHRRTGTTITLCQRSQEDEGIQIRRTTLYVKMIMVKSEEWGTH